MRLCGEDVSLFYVWERCELWSEEWLVDGLWIWLSFIPFLPVLACHSSIKRWILLPHPLNLAGLETCFGQKNMAEVCHWAYTLAELAGCPLISQPPCKNEKPKETWRKTVKESWSCFHCPTASWTHLSGPAVVMQNRSTTQPSLDLIPDP